VPKILPGRQVFGACEPCALAHARVGIGEQTAHRRQREPAFIRLLGEAERAKPAQHSAQRRGVRAEPLGELRFAERSGVQRVEEPRFESGDDHAGRPVAVDELDQARPVTRGRHLGHRRDRVGFGRAS